MVSVQLVPGTEVAVAPKRRKRNCDSHQESSFNGSEGQQHVRKALLRLQDLHERFMNKYEVGGVEIGVAITSAIFIHPESASKYSFNSLDLVEVVPRTLSKETKNIYETDRLRTKSSRTVKEANNGYPKNKQEPNQAIVRLLFSESVAKGHVMLSPSLRLYLSAGLHSCRYILLQIE